MTQWLSLKKKPYNSDDATPTHNREVCMRWEYFQRQNAQLIYFLGIHLLILMIANQYRFSMFQFAYTYTGRHPQHHNIKIILCTADVDE